MADPSVELTGMPPRHANGEEGMAADHPDEEGEWGEEDDGFPLGPENNNEEDEPELESDLSRSTKTSSRSGAGDGGGKSHHRSGSERRRKHHHRHHHSSSSGTGGGGRSEKRRRKSAAAAASGVEDGREDTHDNDVEGRDSGLHPRLAHHEEEAGDSRRGASSSSRRRSDSWGDKGGSSPRKLTSSHDHHSRRGSRMSAETEQAPSGQSHSRLSKESCDYGERGGAGGDPALRRREGRDSHGRRAPGKGDRNGGGGGPGVSDLLEAEDGEILEDGELDDDDDGEEGGEEGRRERNENEGPPQLKASRSGSDKYDKYSPSDRKRGSADYRDRWKRDSDEKKRKKKLYTEAPEDDPEEAAHVRSDPSPPAGSAQPAWGSGVSQAAAAKASPNSGSAAGAGFRGRQQQQQQQQQQGARYGKSGGHSGQSPPGLYDSPSYSEESDDGSMMPDPYMDADDKEFENMRLKRAKKRGRDAIGDGRKRGGPPRKKTLMEMAMSERPICKFYMDGKCAKGSGCQFNHDIESPRPKMEVCKYHLTVKGCHKERCLYMHENYPCKYYHTGAKCFSGDRCKFSHAPLTEETRRALALRVAAEDIIDMEDPEYRDYRDYPARDYDSERDYDDGDYESQEYTDPHARPSLLGSPPRAKKIPSLFEIKVTPPGQSPQAGSAVQSGRQAAFHNEVNTNAAAGGLNSNVNVGGMGASGPGGNMNMNQQQQQQQQHQMGPRPGLGLLGPGGPLPARGPNASMMMGMQQQQQQQQLRPGFGLAGQAPFMGQGNNNMNNLQQQQQRALNMGNTNANAINNNNGNLPPVLNMLGTLIRDLQNGPGSRPANMAGQNNMGPNSMGNMQQNNMGNMPQNMGNMPPNSMGNMPPNSMGNMPPNSMGNMPPNNMGNMPQNMGNMPPNSMGNMPQNNMGNMPPNSMGNMPPNNMGNMPPNNMSNMPPNSMSNMPQNMGNMPPNSMGNMPPNSMGNMPPNNMGNMPPNSMGNMGANMSNRNAMNSGGPQGAVHPNMSMPSDNSMAVRQGNNAGDMGQRLPNVNSVGPGLLRAPMPQMKMNTNDNNGGVNTMGSTPVSSSNLYSNSHLAGGAGQIGNVNNPGQEVGIMDVDYRVGQQQPQVPPASGMGDDKTEAEVGDEEKSVVADEEDSNQELSELDKMRRQLEEQLRAEDERAAAEDAGLEEEEMGDGDLEVHNQMGSLENTEEDPAKEDGGKECGKTSEGMVEIPAHLPRKQRELLKRIQQQEIARQREKERQEAAEKAEAEARASQEVEAKAEVDDFYSSEEEGDSGEKQPKLTEVLKKLSQETSSGSATSSTTSAPVTAATPSSAADASSTTASSAAPSTFNIMQMIQAIKSKTGGSSLRDQSSDAQQANNEKKSVVPSPASPPASPTEKSDASVGLGLRLQPLTVDPPVISARPSRPLTYCVVKLTLSQARPYAQLPAGVKPLDSAYRSDPRVKWHVQYMEKQLKKKALAAGSDGGVTEVSSDQKRKSSVDEDTIASPTPENSQKPSVASDPRLKKTDPRLQKAGASPNSSGSAKAVDPRLEKAANRPSDPRLAARAMDPRLNRQNSLSAPAQGGFNNHMGGGMNSMSGPGLNPMSGAINSMNNPMAAGLMGNPQLTEMGGLRGNHMSGLPPMNSPMGMAGVGPRAAQLGGHRGGPMNHGPRGGPINLANSTMGMGAGINRMAGGAGGPMGNQSGAPINPRGMRPQMQGGIFVSGGGDMSTMGAGARAGLPNLPGEPLGNLDPRMGLGPRPMNSSAPLNDPRLKNRAMDPRDPRGSVDPRDPRGGALGNPKDVKDPRSRDPRGARQFADNLDVNMDMGSTNINERYGSGAFGPNPNRLSLPAGEDRNGVSMPDSLSNNPPMMPASLSQPPQSSLPPSLSFTSSSLPSPSPTHTSTSSISEKPSGVAANFDHRNDPRFKRVKRSAGPRAASMDYSSPLAGQQEGSMHSAASMDYSSPLAGQQEGSMHSSVSSASQLSAYNSYNRPKPVPPRLERHEDTPSPSLPDTLEDFDMSESSVPTDIKVKDIFKSIDPTASPFC